MIGSPPFYFHPKKPQGFLPCGKMGTKKPQGTILPAAMDV